VPDQVLANVTSHPLSFFDSVIMKKSRCPRIWDVPNQQVCHPTLVAQQDRDEDHCELVASAIGHDLDVL
jgi:hypothetical protein